MTLEPEYDDNNKIQVILGVRDKTTNKNRKKLLSNQWKIHENFSPSTIENDIGLIELPEPIEFTSDIKAIKISKGNFGEKEINAIAVGWGLIGKGENAKILQTATMKVLPYQKCEKFRENYYEKLTEKNICAVGRGNKGDKIKMICNGDS